MDGKRKFVIIDLFCGAGGTSFGFNSAEVNGEQIAEVLACVNHDPIAIKSHSKNFPGCVHFTEDVRTLDVSKLPRKLPGDNRIWVLWASLECTHFSNAKTGARDADSRTLAHALYPYISHINPDLVKIENVREFMSWGELDEFGKPVDRKKGIHYVQWRQTIESMGYRYKSKLLNSADFGAFQSRTRYFAVFAKPEMPIIFPNPTHDRHGKNGLPKWKGVREVLNLATVGKSIFNRKKRLSDNTFRRILAGLVKFVGNGVNDEYLVRAYGGDPSSKVTSLDSPAPCITTIPHESLVHVRRANHGFMIQYNGKADSSVTSLDAPCRTLTTKDRFGSVLFAFMDNQFGTGVPSSINEPCHALTTVPKSKLIMAQFMDNQFGKSKPTSLGAPSGALTTNPKCNLVSVGFGIRSNGGHPKDRVFSLCNPMNTLTTSPNQQLVSAAFLMPTNFNNDPTSLDDPSPVITANRKWHYLVNPAFGWPAHSIKKPCFTLVAKMDKAPPYLMTVEENENTTFTATPRPEYYADTTICPELRILAFMKDYGIEDIFMRMLEIEELKRIQGFPECYILLGTKNNQKKFIGNAVVPQVVSAWACAYYMEINEAKTIQLQMF